MRQLPVEFNHRRFDVLQAPQVPPKAPSLQAQVEVAPWPRFTDSPDTQVRPCFCKAVSLSVEDADYVWRVSLAARSCAGKLP
jgi:hypothetical protein